MKRVRGWTFVRQFQSVCEDKGWGWATLCYSGNFFKIIFVRLLKIKLSCCIFSNLNPTPRKIKCLSISKASRLILCRDTIYVHSENRVEHKDVECWETSKQLISKLDVHIANVFLGTVLSLFYAVCYDL